MTIIEILLLIAGAVIFALGFFIPEKSTGLKSTEKEEKAFAGKLKEITSAELKDAERKVRDIVNEEVSSAHDSSVRSMEKITNEKIMAINEYGKTVTDEIERNHKEVVFMYDMLNDKTTDIKNTIRKYEALEKKGAKASNQAVKKPEPAKNNEKKTENAEVIHIPKMFASADMKLPETTGSTADNKAVKEVSPTNNEIIRLHNEQVADIDIAKKLGIGVGEVRLAISLNGAGGSDGS
ncbi:MAG: hypothetical protein K6G03_05615 [Lachnospiraceae bacterium]|nr:hypothetical protein [Lachnospiraceae bacterium]